MTNKQQEHINDILFDIFGLCPDYHVTWTDKEWIEFYEAPRVFWNINSRPDDPFPSPTVARLYLTEHQTKLDNGLLVSACFAVHHPSKDIYLRVMDIGGSGAWSMYKHV